MQAIKDVILFFAVAIMVTGIGLLISFVFADRASAAAQHEMQESPPRRSVMKNFM